jgi:raffinose/stachyose/melibiose transport system permease protein
MTSQRLATRRETVLNYTVLTIFVATTLLPLVGLITSALGPPNASSATMTFPRSLHFSNIATAWNEGHFSQYLISSVIVSTASSLLCCALSLMAGYALGTMEFRGREFVFYMFLLGIMVPEEALIVPLYFDLRNVGLTDTYWSLILPQSAAILSFGVFWMRAFFRSTSPALREAAAIDGASSWTTLVRVLLPISRPALLTLALLSFMWTWNEFLLPLVMIATESRRTAPLGLSFFRGEHLTQYSQLSAAAMIVAAPIVLLYIVLNRRFIAGMMAGAVKE